MFACGGPAYVHHGSARPGIAHRPLEKERLSLIYPILSSPAGAGLWAAGHLLRKVS